jgi:hypothetical protein
VLRALRQSLRRLDARRVGGVLLLVAFALLVALAASHLHADCHHEAEPSDECGVCVATASIGTSESFAPPPLVVGEFESAPPPHPPAPQVLTAAELPRALAPRPPPSLA